MKVKTGSDWEGERAELLEGLREFAAVMRRRPFQNYEGLRGVSAFALYWFVKKVEPDVVFEVGVWKGFSTWLVEQAAPRAELHCFDPIFLLDDFIDHEKVGETYRSPRAYYTAQDFSCAGVGEIAARHRRPLAFFDDHQNKLPRLMQCREAGVREIVFDDNTAGQYTHRTLEQERRDPRGLAALEREVEAYEIFPALWDVDFRVGAQHIEEEGLGFPVGEEFADIHAERGWHSYVTHVRLK